VLSAGGVRQTEMHTAEPFVLQPSASEVEVDVGKLKRYKSPNVDRFLSELIRAGGETLPSENHITYYVVLEQRRIASPVERVNCGTYSQKG
jgi:hypothetical protein